MIKSFVQYAQENLIKFMEEKFPDMKCKKWKSKLIFSKRLESEIFVFILIRFFSDKDYVIPNLAWSRKNKIPEEDGHDYAKYDAFRKNNSSLDDHDDVFLRATCFNYQKSWFSMPHKEPLPARIEEIFTSKSAIDTLKSIGLTEDDWRNNDVFRCWSFIDITFPGQIRLEDIEFAMNPVLEQLKDLVVDHFAPYIAKLNSLPVKKS